jgi:hypothetical protein
MHPQAPQTTTARIRVVLILRRPYRTFTRPTTTTTTAPPGFSCSQWQSYPPLDISVFFPLLNVAPNNIPICQWTFRCLCFPLLIVAPSDSLIRPWTFWCSFLFWMLLQTTSLTANGHFGVFAFLFWLLLPVTVLSALGHFGVLSSFERCYKQHP